MKYSILTISLFVSFFFFFTFEKKLYAQGTPCSEKTQKSLNKEWELFEKTSAPLLPLDNKALHFYIESSTQNSSSFEEKECEAILGSEKILINPSQVFSILHEKVKKMAEDRIFKNKNLCKISFPSLIFENSPFIPCYLWERIWQAEDNNKGHFVYEQFLISSQESIHNQFQNILIKYAPLFPQLFEKSFAYTSRKKGDAEEEIIFIPESHISPQILASNFYLINDILNKYKDIPKIILVEGVDAKDGPIPIDECFSSFLFNILFMYDWRKNHGVHDYEPNEVSKERSLFKKNEAYHFSYFIPLLLQWTHSSWKENLVCQGWDKMPSFINTQFEDPSLTLFKRNQSLVKSIQAAREKGFKKIIVRSGSFHLPEIYYEAYVKKQEENHKNILVSENDFFKSLDLEASYYESEQKKLTKFIKDLPKENRNLKHINLTIENKNVIKILNSVEASLSVLPRYLKDKNYFIFSHSDLHKE